MEEMSKARPEDSREVVHERGGGTVEGGVMSEMRV